MRMRRLLPFSVGVFAAAAILGAVVVAVAPAFAQQQQPFEPEEAEAVEWQPTHDATVPVSNQVQSRRPLPTPVRPVCHDDVEPASAAVVNPVTETSSDATASELPTQVPCAADQAAATTTNANSISAQTTNDGQVPQAAVELLLDLANSNSNLQQNQVNVYWANHLNDNNFLLLNEVNEATNLNLNLQQNHINDQQAIQQTQVYLWSEDQVALQQNQVQSFEYAVTHDATFWRDGALSLLDRAEAQINAGQYDWARLTLASAKAHAHYLAQINQPAADLLVRAQYLATQADLLEHATAHLNR